MSKFKAFLNKEIKLLVFSFKVGGVFFLVGIISLLAAKEIGVYADNFWWDSLKGAAISIYTVFMLGTVWNIIRFLYNVAKNLGSNN